MALVLGAGCAAPAPVDRGEPSASSVAAPTSTEAPHPAPPPPASAPSGASSAVGPSVPVAKRRYVVAAVGDSLTDKRAPGEQYPELLAKMCPESRFDNYGKGGDMVNQMRRRLLRDVMVNGVAYSHVIVFGGVNDLYSDETAGRTPALIEGDLTIMYDAVKKGGAEVVALTIAPWGGFRRYNPSRAKAMKEVNAWILAGAREGRVKHAIDTVPLLSCGDPERLCEEVTHRPFVDGLHFDEEGQKKVAKALYARVFADCK